jgi:acetoin utilization protein AcuB
MGVVIPEIREFMSTAPEVISPGMSVANVQRMFSDLGIRHAPVVQNDELVGLVSQTDLRMFDALDDLDPEDVPVQDIMQPHPYHVPPNAPLDEVALAMAARKQGSAVVVDDDKVVGIFTTVDALRVLGNVLRYGRPQ